MRSLTCPKADGSNEVFGLSLVHCDAIYAVPESCNAQRRDSIAAAHIGYYATEAEASAARARHVEEAGDR